MNCRWAAVSRLVCRVYTVTEVDGRFVGYDRMIALDADGGNLKTLSKQENGYSRGFALSGGGVIDWLPDQDGQVLMARYYVPDDHVGSRLGSTSEGLGVDRVNTRSLAVTSVESAAADASEYITDGFGAVRIRGMRAMLGGTGMESGVTHYYYRRAGSNQWLKLGDLNGVDDNGFNPYAVDRDHDVAYGFEKKDGRLAFYSLALDGSMKKALIFARPDVDVDGLIRIGRRNRVVGVSFATDQREPVYFDPDIAKLAVSLAKALPKQPLVRVIDASADEGKLLLFAGSDDDPGAYYVLDRKTRHLETLFAARGDLEGRQLATVRAIHYPAADGTMIPAYLTLPPGKDEAKGLPAIVLPHGGPASRDEWGFDWLPQFYAARGYAVLQPEYRGSTGYGEAWFQKNGFRSWPIAIGDVLDAGRWMVKQGMADPSKLAIVGWSYGGYAALQSAVVDPGLFKAVVAVAPVTDLAMLKQESAGWTDAKLVRDYIGEGPYVRDGSPARNAGRIKAPVLMFHGTRDRNVGYAESTLMNAKLAESGDRHELVTYQGLDHQLEDATARSDMLRRSDAFLRAAMGL